MRSFVRIEVKPCQWLGTRKNGTPHILAYTSDSPSDSPPPFPSLRRPLVFNLKPSRNLPALSKRTTVTNNDFSYLLQLWLLPIFSRLPESFRQALSGIWHEFFRSSPEEISKEILILSNWSLASSTPKYKGQILMSMLLRKPRVVVDSGSDS